MNDTLPFIAKELIDREVVKNGIENQRTQVLKEEKCTIGNLWTQVLEHYSQVARVSIRVFFETLLVIEDSSSLLGSRREWEG